MANSKPNTVTVTGKVVNVCDIVWPQDTYGVTSMLKKEGARAIGRIKGDEDKLAVVMETLKCLAQHAQTKMDEQKRQRERQIAAAENMRLAEEARRKADSKAEVARLEKEIKLNSEKLEALKGGAAPQDVDTPADE